MPPSKTITTYVQRLIDALVVQGVRRVVISPGSRSTPVALLLAHNAKRYQLQLFVDVDERSAAFFALGMTKQTHEPTLLVCTSGTAAANYYPAVIEAQLTHQPLIVLTTDRPAELTNIGAPQAIDQTGLYGNHVKQFAQLPISDDRAETVDYVGFNVQRMVLASQANPAGPVHLNLPLRKPLMPDLAPVTGKADVRAIDSFPVSGDLSEAALESLSELMSGRQGVFVAGPKETADDWSGLVALAEAVNWPILADPLSGLRASASPLVMTGYDALLAAPVTLGIATPEVVVRFGATPVSANLAGWLKAFSGPVIKVDETAQLNDHTRSTSVLAAVSVATFARQLRGRLTPASERYGQAWQALQRGYVNGVTAAFATASLTEGQVAHVMGAELTDANVFVSNSMPIRDVDSYVLPGSSAMQWLCNRGANGIDGVVSSALGMSAVSDRANYLLIGDLAFFHDMNALMMAKRHQLDLTIVVVNNNGGGIFEFLPQAAAADYFEPLFGTPQDLDLAGVATLYDAHYQLVRDTDSFREALGVGSHGLRMIEVRTDRKTNVAETGKGAPTWVLLHGFMGSHNDYDEVVSRLPGTVLVPDLLGHGGTVAPTGMVFSMAAQVDVLHEWLHQEHTIELPVQLVGYSMGGRVAIAYAVTYPEDVARLVVESGRPGMMDAGERAVRRQHDEALAMSLLTDGLTRFVDRWKRLSLFATQTKLSAEKRATVRAGRLAQSSEGLAHSLRDMGTGAQPDFWPALSSLRMPVTLVTGELDTKFTTIADRMAAQLPEATHQVVPGVGHNVHLEAPDLYVAALIGGMANADR